MNGSERERVKPPTRSAPPVRAARSKSNAQRARSTQDRPADGHTHDYATLRVRSEGEPGAGTGPTQAAPSAAAPANAISDSLDRFAHDSAALTQSHQRAIDALADAIAARLAASSGARVDLEMTGHTDTSGSEAYNDTLGEQRALGVKAALLAALSKRKIGADRLGTIATRSAGENQLAKPTRDGVREARNRRVTVEARIEEPAWTISPDPEPGTQPTRPPIDLTLPPDYPIPKETWWERTERERRRIEEIDRKYRRKPRSAVDVLVDGVNRVLDPILGKLPKKLRELARDGIRKGIESGTEKGCDAAAEGAGLPSAETEAIKAACKAALKTPPSGGQR